MSESPFPHLTDDDWARAIETLTIFDMFGEDGFNEDGSFRK